MHSLSTSPTNNNSSIPSESCLLNPCSSSMLPINRMDSTGTNTQKNNTHENLRQKPSSFQKPSFDLTKINGLQAHSFRTIHVQQFRLTSLYILFVELAIFCNSGVMKVERGLAYVILSVTPNRNYTKSFSIDEDFWSIGGNECNSFFIHLFPI